MRDRAEKAETLLRDAVNSMSEGFVIYDRDDRFIMCNDSLVAGARLEDIYHQILANGGGGDAARAVKRSGWMNGCVCVGKTAERTSNA